MGKFVKIKVLDIIWKDDKGFFMELWLGILDSEIMLMFKVNI